MRGEEKIEEREKKCPESDEEIEVAATSKSDSGGIIQSRYWILMIMTMMMMMMNWCDTRISVVKYSIV